MAFALTESILILRMATGLGMTPEEWAELRSKVDDSFWVMRIIGIAILTIYDDRTLLTARRRIPSPSERLRWLLVRGTQRLRLSDVSK